MTLISMPVLTQSIRHNIELEDIQACQMCETFTINYANLHQNKCKFYYRDYNLQNNLRTERPSFNF